MIPTYRKVALVDEAEDAFGQFSAEMAEVADNLFARRDRSQPYIAGEEVGGIGGEAMSNGEVTAVPLSSGIGARAGVSVDCIKFTPKRNIDPF